ncbi:MAG: alpha/beta hydrolase [Candidatus Aminicenantes bacterium]|nr:alpha/beta hydrolase [Candidatus Aminicenantes bacterium]
MTVEDLLAVPPTPADHVIDYGEDPLQFGQLRLPEGNGLFPVIIVVHGGCWLAQYDLQHISPLATALTREGFATWSLEYRRVGNKGGGWPETFRDVAQGVDHLRELAKEFPLDLNRVIAIGHSAGGHLALWLASRPRLPEKSPLYAVDPLSVHGVVSLAGVGDLRRPEYQEICGGVILKLMGGAPSQVPERYAQGSPIELLPLHVPQILIQGALDQTVSPASAQAYHEAARKSGDKTQLIVIREAGHFEVVVPTTSSYPKVRDAVLSLKR